MSMSRRREELTSGTPRANRRSTAVSAQPAVSWPATLASSGAASTPTSRITTAEPNRNNPAGTRRAGSTGARPAPPPIGRPMVVPPVHMSEPSHASQGAAGAQWARSAAVILPTRKASKPRYRSHSVLSRPVRVRCPVVGSGVAGTSGERALHRVNAVLDNKQHSLYGGLTRQVNPASRTWTALSPSRRPPLRPIR
jgi:hypothetical protein